MHSTTGEAVEELVEGYLSRMTVREMVSLCHAGAKFATNGVPRLGITGLVLSDGPHGVRPEFAADSWDPLGGGEDFSTYLPTATALAATWSVEMAQAFGGVLGAETRARGKDMILGPGFNILRDPRCGRAFEYFGEDPVLSSEIAVGVIAGIQEQGAAACAKHFAMNSQEWNRGGVDAQPDEGVFREIYAPAFEAAVRQGGVFAVMGAYNKFHGQWCSHNDRLLNQILKGEWEFDGVVVSDWCAVHDTTEAALNGLDLEMGTNQTDYSAYFLADPFRKEIEAGRISIDVLRDKARRLLRLLARVGKLGGRQAAGRGPCERHESIALEIASQAIVLLKNDGILPLDPRKKMRIAVIGDNADRRHGAGGGSSEVKSRHEVTPLDALGTLLGEDADIVFARGYPDTGVGLAPIPPELLAVVDIEAGIRGWAVEWRDAPWITNVPPVHENRARLEVTLPVETPPVAHFHRGVWSSVWKAGFVPARTGVHTFALCSDSDSRLFVEGGKLIDLRQNHTLSARRAEIFLEAGRTYALTVEYAHEVGEASLQLGLCQPGDPLPAASSLRDEALAAARSADLILYFGGLNHLYESEGCDRAALSLPGDQDSLIDDLAEANPNLVVTLIAGSPVEMPWIGKVPAVLFGWYAGMEAGTAIVRTIFGFNNPSGKLPFTMPQRLADTPAVMLGDYDEHVCHYLEGLLVGYRWYDRKNIGPLFPFGFGLSYARFSFSDFNAESRSDGGALVRVRVTNDSGIGGWAVPQIYVGHPGVEPTRPLRELKGFRKIFLRPGESSEVTWTLTPESCRRWIGSGWVPGEGAVEAAVGFSSRDLAWKGTVVLAPSGPNR